MARDKERRAQWESGVWEDPWGVDLVNEVDAALATEEDIREERETATEGRQLLVQRQERQGQEVRTHKPNKWPDGHDDIQRDEYDGHHRDHGLSYQAVRAPDGMVIDVHGPESGRRHDVHLLRKSNHNARLAAVQNPEDEVQHKVYGDAAYPVLSHVRRGFRGANLSSKEEAFNQANSAMRISIEWAFGKVVNMYPFCDFRKNQKLFLQPLAKYHINACILTNAHTCLRGSQTGTYFDLHAPTLEE
eukprot:jgi/Undpi1/1152/HiC_scaffold_10.g04614.m1